MARHYQPTAENLAAWELWVDSRPPIIKELARRFPPWELFRLKSSGHRVFAYSYAEDGTLTVVVSGKFNAVLLERRVFGIRPDDLEPCELPTPGEPLGSVAKTPEEALLMIKARCIADDTDRN